MKTLLLLHGGPGFDDSYFYPFFNELKSDFKIISYTLGSNAIGVDLEALVNELDDFISNIECDELIVYAHSFAPIVLSGVSELSWKKIDRAILSNWVIDNKWIQKFYNSYPETLDFKWTNLRQQSLNLLDYYFINQKRGREVFEKIAYNDDVYLGTQNIYENLDISESLARYSNKIVSISSSEDKITTQSYIKASCTDINVLNYNVEGAGHFPFIDNWTEFEVVFRKAIS